MTALSPIGWAVLDGRGGTALFLERPPADAFAVKVHGTVDAVYSGAQLAELLKLDAAGHPVGAAQPDFSETYP